jgi:hypothetical protein
VCATRLRYAPTTIKLAVTLTSRNSQSNLLAATAFAFWYFQLHRGFWKSGSGRRQAHRNHATFT